MLLSMLLVGVVVGTPAGSVPPTTIMSIFIDDLGFYDTAVSLTHSHSAVLVHLL
jgi:hypothetical protein